MEILKTYRITPNFIIYEILEDGKIEYYYREKIDGRSTPLIFAFGILDYSDRFSKNDLICLYYNGYFTEEEWKRQP